MVLHIHFEYPIILQILHFRDINQYFLAYFYNRFFFQQFQRCFTIKANILIKALPNILSLKLNNLLNRPLFRNHNHANEIILLNNITSKSTLALFTKHFDLAIIFNIKYLQHLKILNRNQLPCYLTLVISSVCAIKNITGYIICYLGKKMPVQYL